ncbi:MAG: dihydroneopterin aldolase family protein [Thermoplasmata archaeon]|nr:dihydroneopterin aldolase family protein [Thermoplasmata archaeon]
MDDPAKKYFNCNDKERAVFEAGIKLGTIYHQFVGTPFNSSNITVLEKAIEESVKVQPFVKGIKVRINAERIKKGKGLYKYLTLTGDMLDVDLVIEYNNIEAYCSMKYIEEMNYPLMFIREIRVK